ncbi:MAG: lytic transglycosylase domain-containing protein [Methylococcaceae bacterium]|nr:lytic transglycosylase domain-containing protein [Methylococcaceae bacterium]
MKLNSLLKFTWIFMFLPVCVSADKLNDQREAFLQAEKYLTEKNETGFFEVSSSLTDYPLYPYLRYQWVKEHLDNSGLMLAFLSDFKNTRYAGALRSKWLDYLAEQGRWQDFARNYLEDESSGDDCRWHWAKYQTGQSEQAFSEAKRLWLLGQSIEKYCQPLFSVFEKSPLLTQDLIWQRFENAIENNHVEAAKTTLRLIKQPERKKAETWLQLHQKPDLVTDKRYWEDKTAQTGRLFAHAVKRLANADLEKAIIVWDAKRDDFQIEKPVADAVERKFGLALLGKKDNRAYSHLSKVSEPDEETRSAEVRAALLEQIWQHVNTAISGLTSVERQEPKWRYWQARALQETGNKQQADTLYKALATDRSFYGFMAADTVNLPYKMNDSPVKVSDEAIKRLSDETNFKACWELKWLSKDLESRRQWQFAIKNLSKEELLIAAKLAQQWHWDQQAITTLVKADYWDDMAIRFPLNYLGEVQSSAEKHSLEPALLFGLMRQESMLDKNAESSAGAKGLMQLMPETAKRIAQTLHEPWQSDADLFKPELNIHFGRYYFKDLLSRFNNHLAVAGAAYNAGPSRAIKWLPTVSAIPADVWIETIPFKETRKYVSTVLSYAIVYQQRLKKGSLKLKNLMRDVQPE